MMIPMCMSCFPGDTKWFEGKISVLIKCTENVFDERLHEYFLFYFVSIILFPSFMHDTQASSQLSFFFPYMHDTNVMYSNTCVKRPL